MKDEGGRRKSSIVLPRRCFSMGIDAKIGRMKEESGAMKDEGGNGLQVER